MLAFLGWNPGTEQELFTQQELINAFSLEHIHKAGAKFDFEKAKWFNAEYIKNTDNEILANLVQQNVQQKFGAVDKSFLIKVVGLVKERLTFLNDIEHFAYLFQPIEQYEETSLSKVNKIKEVLDIDKLTLLFNNFSDDSVLIETSLKEFAQNNELKIGELMKFIRTSLVGELSGPAIPDLIVLLGNETSINRIKNCFSQL